MLAIHDTTALNFTKHAGSKEGFGEIGNGRDIGLYVHPTIVVEAAGAGAIGVNHAGGILGLAGVSANPRAMRRGRPCATASANSRIVRAGVGSKA